MNNAEQDNSFVAVHPDTSDIDQSEDENEKSEHPMMIQQPLKNRFSDEEDQLIRGLIILARARGDRTEDIVVELRKHGFDTNHTLIHHKIKQIRNKGAFIAGVYKPEQHYLDSYILKGLMARQSSAQIADNVNVSNHIRGTYRCLAKNVDSRLTYIRSEISVKERKHALAKKTGDTYNLYLFVLNQQETVNTALSNISTINNGQSHRVPTTEKEQQIIAYMQAVNADVDKQKQKAESHPENEKQEKKEPSRPAKKQRKECDSVFCHMQKVDLLNEIKSMVARMEVLLEKEPNDNNIYDQLSELVDYWKARLAVIVTK